ncbi:MAG TPA: L,D-transpeptidase family protein [Thermoanaerobaculia bacterium]|jgi:murein L,D-transpeptidase YcbB/YkuD|nr:L,D-transpeptidase family protein [Thermoanaerobaculia bacterium]
MTTLKKYSISISTLLLTLAIAGCNQDSGGVGIGFKPKAFPPEISQLLRQTVEVKVLPASLKDQKELQKAWTEMQGFYRKRNFQPAWFTPSGLRPQAGELIQAIPSLGADGLDIRRYQPQKLEAFVKEMKETKSFDDPETQRRLVDTDVELTYTYLSLASHLATGRLQPEKLRVEWYTKPRNVDLDARLGQAMTADSPGEIVKILRSLNPSYPDYQRLTKALASYKVIAAQGGWNAVPPGPVLKTGGHGPRVAALRSRLAASGDLPAAQPAPSTQPAQGTATGAPGPDVYDAALASAVSRFQQRHGLEVTGKVDEDTLAELNVPVQDRIRQLQVNMERWRWLPGTFGDRYILVNVPEFRLDLVEAGKTALTMRVVVGKDQSRTPAFSDKMSYIELNPEWNIPDTIAQKEILPKLASDPGYLARHNMEVVPGSKNRLRQRAGDDNPLGKIKFMFPNEFDIYLHDTPADHLFSKAERDFSHGCIRLEKPIELAAYLLKGDPKWTPEAIQAAIDSGEHETITLPRPLPVHILYWTAWVEPDGTVEFRKDIYDHDDQLEQALAKEPPVWIDPQALRGEVRAAK